MPRQMKKSLFTLLIALLAASPFVHAQDQQDLQPIRFAIATKAISPIVINILIPEYLGYYAEEGLTVEVIPLGSNQAAMAALAQGRVDFSVGVPSFQLPLAAQGEAMPMINFYEYTYPFKWAVAVSPDSDVQSLEDLRGQTVGVANFGTTDYPVGQALFQLAGLDPENDVEWLAVGEGVTAGQALQKGDIAALVYYDTGFGQIEAAGIDMRYLPLPENTPKVGGLYVATSQKVLDEHKDWAVGVARAIAKGSLFVETNPEAAAHIYLQMYPEAAARGATLAEQIEAVAVPIRKRMPLYRSYDPDITRWGDIRAQEWQDELSFLGLEGQVEDTSQFYTTDLIDEINQFDESEVIEDAQNYEIPEN